MENLNLSAILPQQFDLLLLVNPEIKILESTAKYLRAQEYSSINLSKELSKALISEPMQNRTRFTTNWFKSIFLQFDEKPVLCTTPDLLFEPSLFINPFILFRQASRLHRLIVTWPGDYQSQTLSYAIPEHGHYRTWMISNDMLHNPKTFIQRIEPY